MKVGLAVPDESGRFVLDYAKGPNPAQERAHDIDADDHLFGGALGGGKLLALSTLLPTAQGWTTMGAVEVGEWLFDEKGRPCRVTYKSPVVSDGVSYRVTFDDGSVIYADAEHRWLTMTNSERSKALRRSPEARARRRAKRPSRAKVPAAGETDGRRLRNGARMAMQNAVVAAKRADEFVTAAPQGSIRTTQEILDTLMHGTGANHSIDLATPLQGVAADLPIDPYTLGAWLGDGSRDSGRMTGIDVEIFDEIRSAGYQVSRCAPTVRDPIANAWHVKGLIVDLRSAGVLMNKHVPERYMRASVEQRLSLLQGLMDTDGCCNEDGQVEFCNTNRRLADSVFELACSLGLKPTITEGRATLYGKDCGPKWTVKWTATLPVFRLQRKLDRLPKKVRPTTLKRYVVSVERVPSMPMQCIAVDSPSHLYLAGKSMIPTHNTDWIIAKVLGVLLQYPGANGLILRRTYAELTQRGGIIQRLQSRIPPTVGSYNGGTYIWTFYNGSSLELGHLNNGEADLPRYLGAEYAIVGIDQADEFLGEWVYRLRTRLRVSGRVRDSMVAKGFRPKLCMSANPTGIGLAWLKRDFVDPFPLGNVVFSTAPSADDPIPRTRCYTPAKVFDNLANVGEEYLGVFAGMAEEERKAFRDGSWDVLAGVRFSAWNSSVHVVDPEQFPIPEGGIARGLGIDYGQEQPFVGLWGARLADDLIVVYREVHERGLSAEEQARLLLASESPGERMEGRHIVTHLDPACWAPSADKPLPRTAGGTVVRPSNAPPPGSIADTYQRAGLRCERADNRRIEGWAEIASRLRHRNADGTPRPGGPRLLVYSTCTNLIRTLPTLPRSKRNPEDIDGGDNDHDSDALRYLCSALRQARPSGGMSSLDVFRNPTRRPSPGLSPALPGSVGGQTVRRVRRSGF